MNRPRYPGERTILFTGYAPVHFVCFRPLYERLVQLGDCSVFLSGGLRSKAADEYSYDERALYDPFGVPGEHILALEEARERDFDLLFAANTKMLTPRSSGARIQIFHGISFRNRSIRAANTGCDHYFIVGPYMLRRFCEAGILREDDPRALKIGFPKTDRLLDESLDREELLRLHGFDGSRPVILYCPTGERHNSLETMGEEVIERLARAGSYDLLIKLHDHPKNKAIDWPARLVRREDAHTRLARDFDVVPLLFLADLLITDASSVSNEFSLLDRPMIFLDVPKLLAKARRRAGSMTDLETWGRKGGAVVAQPEEVVSRVEHALANPGEHSPIRRAMARDLFYNPGMATERALTWLCAGP